MNEEDIDILIFRYMLEFIKLGETYFNLIERDCMVLYIKNIKQYNEELINRKVLDEGSGKKVMKKLAMATLIAYKKG